MNATGNQNTTGNAATATKLQTARTIGGVSFDGTANINLPGVNVAGNQNTSGNAATATKLQTARTINGVLFDGSKNIELTPRSIGTINSTTMSFSGGTGWFKLATVTMPQSSSVVYISLIGGSGYNVNSPMQAGISELVLRAGNGNPKGLTGALWRRTSVGFTNFAWVNTSGDTYDVYVEIGNYTTRVNIQWDYTSNASVTIHTSPSYTADKPTGLTDGTVYVIYSSHIKPTATDVGALPITGGNLKGGLTATGEIISKSANGLRIAYGNYGFFIRNDGSHTFFMLTDSGNSLGTYNNLRPLIINNANGTVTIGNGLNVTGGINGSLNGNAATATKLQTARTIGGVSFDGSANIDLPGVNKAGNQSTTGNAATATKLQTARTINGVSFDGTKDITLTPKDLDAYSKSEVQSALAGKQPLDNTLTNLSGKDVAGLLAYLGLGETINKASGAMQKSANGSDISDVSAFRNALQLGTAATRDVGADNASKLLDLGSFMSMMSGNGYIYIPCIATTGNPVKLMLQWGTVATQKGVDAIYALPFAFPYAGLFATGNRGTSGYNAAMNVRIASRTHISIQNWAPSGEGTEDCCFIALGY
nr:hypothetical protein [Escherichia coli]